MRQGTKALLGESLFTQDGLHAKRLRDVIRKQFSRIRYHNLGIFADHVELLVRQLQDSPDSVINLEPWFLKFTLDTTTSLLFGESVESLLKNSDDGFGKSFDEAVWVIALRMKLADFYWAYNPQSFVRACDQTKAYADAFVKKALDQEPVEGEDTNRYLFIRNLYEDLGDRVLVRDQLMGVLLAGRDTTASLLSWTFRLLVRHQSVLQRLQSEIDTVLAGSTRVDKTVIQNMPYLRSVVTETLRLYPSAPINSRLAMQTTTLPRGGGPDGMSPVLVRKGDGIGFSPYHMHRRTDLYGSDAREFRPERWEDGSLQDRIGYGYVPFNGGPRVCLGRECFHLPIIIVAANIQQRSLRCSRRTTSSLESYRRFRI